MRLDLLEGLDDVHVGVSGLDDVAHVPGLKRCTHPVVAIAVQLLLRVGSMTHPLAATSRASAAASGFTEP
eukprot:3426148-Prymnesium_polylepis.1